MGARRVIRAADVGAIDARAVELGASGATLMERAGAAVAASARAMLSNLLGAGPEGGAVAVLAGPGGNGGDGYVAARLLREAGVDAVVIAAAPPDARACDAAAAAERWRASGGPTLPWSAEAAARIGAVDLVVDALFGVGLTRPPKGAAAEMIAAASAEGAPPALAVDTPSGVRADDGGVAGSAIRARRTITFVAKKPGHLLAPGALYCGAVETADILGGVEAAWDAAAPSSLEATTHGVARRLEKAATLHKYGHGSVLVAAGGLGATGAARLSAAAALRVGAGLVTVAAPEAAMPECAAQLTAVMLRAAETPEDFAARAVERRATAVVIGPGHAAHPGGFARTRATIAALIDSGFPGALALDADALTAWSADHAESEGPDALFALIGRAEAAGARMVLTPHDGEFARLFPEIAARRAEAEAGFGKIEAVAAAARRSGATVLLKGPDTVISAPDGPAIVVSSFETPGAAWLATAGSGDVLVGAIAGLLARGAGAAQAAADAAILHREAADALGAGLIAEDLPAAMPSVLRRLAAEERVALL